MPKKLTTEEFIKKSVQIHNNFYDYSKVNYINCRIKIKIICPKHGEFEQTPNAHLHGNKCPKCVFLISNPEIEFLNYLNIKQENRQKYIKPYRVDALQDNIVYEFLGYFWHGNPNRFNPTDINKIRNETFLISYKNTFNKFENLKNNGYSIKYIWELDWKKI